MTIETALPERDPNGETWPGRARVLSVQTPNMGHGTYGRLIRQHLAEAETCSVDSVWADADRSLVDRLANRLLFLAVPGRRIARANLDLRRFRREVGIGLLARSVARRQMRRRRYDVLHYHTQALASVSLDLMRRIPTVLSGDMTAALVAQEASGVVPAWTYGPSVRLEKRLFEAATRVVLWSDWAARSVISDYGIDPGKVSVINPSVNLEVFSPSLDRPASSDGPVKLLFVGSDFARKGGPDVLDVFAHEFAQGAELHLVTSAPLDGLPPNVYVHRGIAAYSPEWLALYQSMDIFVLPTHAEAFGLVFMEAMAAGLPVVATRINAIPEMVTEGETGLLVAPGDRRALAAALHALVDDARLRHGMGRAGRTFAERHFDAGRISASSKPSLPVPPGPGGTAVRHEERHSHTAKKQEGPKNVQ